MKFMTHNKNHEEFKKNRERRKGIEKNKIRDRFLKNQSDQNKRFELIK